MAKHLSQGFKIDELAERGEGIFSVDALFHAISGSVRGNVTMLGKWLCSPWWFLWHVGLPLFLWVLISAPDFAQRFISIKGSV